MTLSFEVMLGVLQRASAEIKDPRAPLKGGCRGCRGGKKAYPNGIGTAPRFS
jgi:hypothetical protein